MPKRSAWGDPTLATRYPCYTVKLRSPQETRVGLIATRDNPAVIMIPFSKTAGKARLVVPFYSVFSGPLFSLREYVNATFDLELK